MSKGLSEARSKLIPVVVDGKVQLLDIYVDGEWFGSRRTEAQCAQALEWILRHDH